MNTAILPLSFRPVKCELLVLVPEQLKSDDGKDVDDDGQNDGQITQSADSVNDNRQ